MSVVINTNYAATVASNNLAASNDMLQRSLNRLSSGSKIVNPSDDAGGLAVSMKLSAAAKRSGAVITNIGNSVSFLQSQDGVLKVAGKVLERIGELGATFVVEDVGGCHGRHYARPPDSRIRSPQESHAIPRFPLLYAPLPMEHVN